MSKKSTDSALNDALKSLERDWGSGFNTRGLADTNYKAISTGHDDLDDILTKGAKGIFLGGICEISGTEGSGKCLTKDTYCLTTDGLLSIEEIFESNDLICDFESNDLVLDADCGFIKKKQIIINGKGEQESTSHFYRNGYGRALRTIMVSTHDGFEIEGTLNHPILVINKSGYIVWKYLSQITKSDYICVRRGTQIWNNQEVLSVEEAALIGFLIGDGSYTNDLKFGFSNSDPRIVDLFKSSFLSCHKEETDSKIKSYGGDDSSIFGKSLVQEFKKKHGIGNEKACDKTIPKSIRISSKKSQISFIRAYFDCDGTFQHDKNNLQFASCSRELLSQLQLMLLNFGIYSYITSCYNSNYEKDYYELELAGKELDIYHEVIGFNNNDKCDEIKNTLLTIKERNTNIDTIPYQGCMLESLHRSIDPDQRSRNLCRIFYDNIAERCELTYSKLNRILESTRLLSKNESLFDHFEQLFKDNYIYSKVTSVKQSNNRTFDFTLPKTHTFWSNGMISHNTSVAMRTVGYAQRQGMNCVWLDAEASFSPDLAILNGCDPSSLIMPELEDTKVASSDGINFLNVSEILEMIYQTIETSAFSLVVLDSVAALMPERILQVQSSEDANKLGVAEVARAMSSFLGKISAACKKTETTVIFINQLRDVPGNQWQPETTPGGRALKFYASQRLRVDKVGGKVGQVVQKNEDGREEVIGHYARCKVIKNRKNRPVLHPVEIPIYYTKYFPDDAKKVFDLGRNLQVIRTRNGIFTWKNDSGQIMIECEGESGFLDKLRTSKLEPSLAAACVIAEISEKNQALKIPIAVSSSIKELAKIVTSSEEKKVESSDKKSKKKTITPALDLN